MGLQPNFYLQKGLHLGWMTDQIINGRGREKSNQVVLNMIWKATIFSTHLWLTESPKQKNTMFQMANIIWQKSRTMLASLFLKQAPKTPLNMFGVYLKTPPP